MKIAVLSLAALFLGHSAMAAIADDLTADEMTKLQKGELIFKTESAPESDWPKTYTYVLINSTPEEMAAVFWDADLYKTYIGSMKESKVVSRPEKNTAIVDYELEVPIVSNEKYTVKNKISTYQNGRSYKIDWRLVKASTTRDSIGWAKIEQQGNGSIMAYYSFVIPGGSMAGIGIIKDKAMKQVRESVRALQKQTEKERGDNRPLLDKQIGVIRTALAP